MWSSRLPFPSLCREEGQPLTLTVSSILDMQATEGTALEDFYTHPLCPWPQAQEAAPSRKRAGARASVSGVEGFGHGDAPHHAGRRRRTKAEQPKEAAVADTRPLEDPGLVSVQS